ncbi:MAG: semialdehyde dehydrogenase [Bacillales bacterium]|jgi:uncharacterized protein YbjT (DUF2867 family)|nr:semialdehyde dehydrogenase [Bacillales bacterium]
MHALVIGATGATGKDLLNLLLLDDFIQRVDIFVRRDVGIQHEKLKIHVVDFNKPEQWKYLVKGDVIFSCLGTTLKVAGSKEAQWKVDYEFQYQFAKSARENNVNHYILVSSGFSSPNSTFFYTRMKGQLEEAVKTLGFPKLTIFNPPILIRKNSNRTSEIVGLKIIQFLNKLGFFRSQRPLDTEILAKAMLNKSKTNENGLFSIKGKEIWKSAGAL